MAKDKLSAVGRIRFRARRAPLYPVAMSQLADQPRAAVPG
jgi:hypothetical protein